MQRLVGFFFFKCFHFFMYKEYGAGQKMAVGHVHDDT